MWPLSESWGTQVVTCVTFLTNYLFVLMLNVPFIICFSASVTYATKTKKKKQTNLETKLLLSSDWTGLKTRSIKQRHKQKLEQGFGTMRDAGFNTDTGQRRSWSRRAQLLVAFRRGADTGALWKGRFTCAGLLSCHIVIPDVSEPFAAPVSTSGSG